MATRYIFFVFAVAVFWTAGWCDDSEEQQDPLALILQNVYLLHERTQEMEVEIKAHLDDRAEEIKNELQTSVREQLGHIAAVVDAMDRRQKLALYCPEGKCGGHGSCDLAENPRGYECTCDNTHHGDNCENVFGPCELKYRELEARGMMPGLELPMCDDEGYFLGMQYRGSMAHCVTREGDEIHDYRVYRWETDDMDCQCARDEFAWANSGKPEKKFACDPNGNYAKVSCDKEFCWCQNSRGERYGGQVAVGNLNKKLQC